MILNGFTEVLNISCTHHPNIILLSHKIKRIIQFIIIIWILFTVKLGPVHHSPRRVEHYPGPVFKTVRETFALIQLLGLAPSCC